VAAVQPANLPPLLLQLIMSARQLQVLLAGIPTCHHQWLDQQLVLVLQLVVVVVVLVLVLVVVLLLVLLLLV
jgi:hypothetical protein